MLCSTTDVMYQFINNPESKAAKGVFDSCLECNKMFIKEVLKIDL